MFTKFWLLLLSLLLFCVDKCKLCEPGSYSNVSRATSCECCPAGFESTYMGSTCIPCSRHEYSTDACEMCKTCDGSNTCKYWENSFFKTLLKNPLLKILLKKNSPT